MGTMIRGEEQDHYTRLRIGNRLIGKDIIDFHMKGRTFIRLEVLGTSDASKFAFAEVENGLNSIMEQENWATAGVIHKRNECQSQAGRSVFYLQLTDLRDNYVNVFLHGEPGQYASLPVGGLVYLVNADVIQSKDGFQRLALSVPSIQHIKHIGNALDYGICSSIQRNGQKCKNAVNKEVSRYCMYHIHKTQETINTMRSELCSGTCSQILSCLDIFSVNYKPNQISEGRFQIGKDCVDCRPGKNTTRLDLSKLAGIAPTKTRTINGVVTGGSIGARLQAQLNEMEHQKKLQQDRDLFLKRQHSMESKENESTPFLGRGLLPGKILRLDSDDEKEQKRLEKIHAVRARLNEINSNPAIKELEMKPSPTHVRDVESPSPSPSPLKNTKIETRSFVSPSTPIKGDMEESILKKCMEATTKSGNPVFDALMEATSGANLEATKQEVMKKRGGYAEKELKDRLYILQERQAQQERREEARREMMSLEVTCYWCANCRQFVENGLGREYCEDHGHFLERRVATKRMFECMTCHTRKGFIDVEMPLSKCNCGGCVWAPCTFYKEKSIKDEELVIIPKSDHVLYGFDIKQKVD